MELNTETIRRAKTHAYRLLASRSQTAYEIRARLVRKGYTVAVIDEVLRQLTAEGYVDDRKVALDWSRYRLQTKPLGHRRLTWELQRRGIPWELAQEAIREIYVEFDEMALAHEAARRRLGSRQLPSIAHEHRRLARYLIGLGFETDMVAAVLRNLSSTPLALEIVPDDDIG